MFLKCIFKFLCKSKQIVSRETHLKRKQAHRKGTPARKGLDKEMGMSGTGTFVPMWKVKSNTQVPTDFSEKRVYG